MATHSSVLAWRIPGIREPGAEGGTRCRGRDAGSVLALTAHTLLCGGPLTCTADPSRPAEDWWLVERLRGLPGGLPSMGSHRVRHD